MLTQVAGAWSVAKKLGIDYANATTGFKFCARCVPIVEGIVIGIESKGALSETWVVENEEKELKAMNKKETMIFRRWKLLCAERTVIRKVHARVKALSEYTFTLYCHLSIMKVDSAVIVVMYFHFDFVISQGLISVETTK